MTRTKTHLSAPRSLDVTVRPELSQTVKRGTVVLGKMTRTKKRLSAPRTSDVVERPGPSKIVKRDRPRRKGDHQLQQAGSPPEIAHLPAFKEGRSPIYWKCIERNTERDQSVAIFGGAAAHPDDGLYRATAANK